MQWPNMNKSHQNLSRQAKRGTKNLPCYLNTNTNVPFHTAAWPPQVSRP